MRPAGSSSLLASQPPAPRSSFGGRGSRRILVVGIILIVVGLAALAAARGAILRTALDAGLAAYGVPDARYRIAAVGFTTTRIVDIQLGAEIAVAEVALRYHPLRLLQVEIDEVTVSGLRLDLTHGLGPFAPQSDASDDAADGPAAMPRLPRLRLIDGVVRVPGGGTVTLGELRSAPLDKGQDVTLANLEVTAAGQRFALRDISARIDWPGGAGKPAATFAVASLRHDAVEPLIAPLTLRGGVRQDGDIWRLTAAANGVATARLDLTASYDSARAVVEGRITVPEIHFVPGALQPSDLSPRLAAMTDARGAVGGHLALRRQAGRLTMAGDWLIDRLGFAIDGVPVESLTAKLALAGDEDPAHAVIRIAEARMALAGGVLSVSRAEVRPLAERNRIVLGFSGLDFGQILAALDITGVGGEGRIDGHIPLVLSGQSVAVETAKIAARGPGVLRIQSEDAKAALAQGGEDANLLLQALADFRFDSLSLTIDKPLDGESRLALATAGHNPTVLDGHPFRINVTVTTNLDKLLAIFTEGSRLSQAAIRAIVGARRSASPDGSR